ncbi:hypothetical protein KIPE111705_26825 [Kibdelosporangium persicum]|uniref:Uncharacterized protein n=1 Tax=Kibdelosporangium persicum TaxID=2698649 RepID=A0ABX2FGW2_9PSEU|nr:hypothetical protein [Kibdelosporangium persicum]NRN70624.1 hypothetical protein [Kibdelosporangium persicum]
MPSTTLPSEGDEFRIRCDAPDAELTLRARPVRVRFTGDCTVRAGARETADGITLELPSLALKAELPDAGGAEDGGTIEVRLKDTEAKSIGHLRASSSQFDMLLVADIVATVRQPGGTIELGSAQPMRLWAHLDHFPPRGEHCRLGAPVDLVVPDSPEATVVQLQDLPLKVETASG